MKTHDQLAKFETPLNHLERPAKTVVCVCAFVAQLEPNVQSATSQPRSVCKNENEEQTNTRDMPRNGSYSLFCPRPWLRALFGRSLLASQHLGGWALPSRLDASSYLTSRSCSQSIGTFSRHRRTRPQQEQQKGQLQIEMNTFIKQNHVHPTSCTSIFLRAKENTCRF